MFTSLQITTQERLFTHPFVRKGHSIELPSLDTGPRSLDQSFPFLGEACTRHSNSRAPTNQLSHWLLRKQCFARISTSFHLYSECELVIKSFHEFFISRFTKELRFIRKRLKRFLFQVRAWAWYVWVKCCVSFLANAKRLPRSVLWMFAHIIPSFSWVAVVIWGWLVSPNERWNDLRRNSEGEKVLFSDE